ncbi:glycosyltransferase family 4 protein [Reinekea forsetii]|nr:glycosyltransferase family 4 protein [Reinekea forsetii]
MTNSTSAEKEITILLGNSNRRFSGVTSTMLQVLEVMSKTEGIAVFGKHHVPKGTPVWGWFKTIIECRSLTQSGLPRVFHARRNDEMIQALVLKYLFRCRLKIVFTSTAQRKKTWITRYLMSKMDGLITTCSAAAAYMPTPPDVVVAHGINLNLFKSTAHNVDLPSKYNIGIFGRVREQKGVDILVEAAAKLLPNFKEWGLVVVGEVTPEQAGFKRQLDERIQSAGIQSQVLFTDKVPFEVLPAYFHSVDIATALSRNEGFGLTVLEAMACGKPVVATKAGAWPDIIENESLGRLIDVGDINALAAALEELMSSSQLRERLGRESQEMVVKHYTVEQEAGRLLNYYREIQQS